MTPAEANKLVGHKLTNQATGTIVTVYDVRVMRDGTYQVYLSNGAIPPLDGIEKQWILPLEAHNAPAAQ
jgi:hypothetical protein